VALGRITSLPALRAVQRMGEEIGEGELAAFESLSRRIAEELAGAR